MDLLLWSKDWDRPNSVERIRDYPGPGVLGVRTVRARPNPFGNSPRARSGDQPFEPLRDIQVGLENGMAVILLRRVGGS